MKHADQFFDFAAEVGLTKHLGELASTEKLIELCHIDKGKKVLDVGCGAGRTPVYLAKQYGCHMVGVDILARMVERSEELAKQQGVADMTEFRVADAQDLPFDDAQFDAVITESVTAFPENKQQAMNEYARVTKPGGYIGLNESTWLKLPPPPDMVAWVSQEIGAQVNPLSSEGWTELLRNAGLRDLVTITHSINIRDESKGILQRYGCRGMLRILWRTLLLYSRNPAYRQFVKRVRKQGIIPENIYSYFGYGLYVGRK